LAYRGNPDVALRSLNSRFDPTRTWAELNPAVQQPSGIVTFYRRFRTIKVRPKDRPTRL